MNESRGKWGRGGGHRQGHAGGTKRGQPSGGRRTHAGGGTHGASKGEQKGHSGRAAATRSGVARYRAGQYRDALRELQAYRRMTGRLDQNHLIADSYRGLGMPEKAVPVAVEAVRSRLREEPRAEAAVVGASALADLGRYDEA